jgi:hypothetical protein
MGLAYNQIDDAVLLTQNKLIERGAFVDMQTDLTDHVAVREMWDARKKAFDGGIDWEFECQMDHNHSARTVGLYETDGSSVADSMKMGKVGVRHVNAHYIYDQREPAFQRGGHAIVDLVTTRNIGMRVSLYELLEEILWGKPVDSSDTKTPYGIAFWILKGATEGWNTTNPAGFSDGRAGIDTTAFPRWANWTGKYTSVTKEDLVRMMRRGHRKTQFRSPVSHAVPTLGAKGNGIYTNDSVIGILEEILENGNMDLGNELASKDGRVMFKGTPLTYAPKLDGDTTNPIYMLDWKTLGIGTMPGWENNLSAPYMVPGKHLVRRVDLDMSLNMICTDLRKQAVFYK